jgi:hypothetical protein
MPASAVETSAHGNSFAAELFDPAVDPPPRALSSCRSTGSRQTGVASSALAFIVDVIYSNA